MFPNTTATLSGSTTRPADTTAYASGDLVANSTTAGSVVPIALGDLPSGQIRRVRIRKSGPSVTNASFRVHLYRTGTITAANGDNGAFSTSASASYLGQVDVTVGQTFTDGAFGAAACEINTFAPVSLYCLLEVRAAYTPASAELFTVTLEALTL